MSNKPDGKADELLRNDFFMNGGNTDSEKAFYSLTSRQTWAVLIRFILCLVIPIVVYAIAKYLNEAK